MARVLVIDDVATNRDVLIPLLHYLDHETAEAADGAQGLALVHSFQPDLIICDILMPTMDGFEFVKRLRQAPQARSTPVLFYSATFLEDEAWVLARSCGVVNVITKPCDPEIVLDIVTAALTSPDTAVDQPSSDVLSSTEFDAEHLRLLSSKLIESTQQLHGANRRLAALTDLSAEMAGERDPVALLLRLCHGVRSLFGARVAVLFLRQGELQEAPTCYTSGVPDADNGRWLAWARSQTWGQSAALTPNVVRWSALSAAAELALVPWGHSEVPRHALAAPLTTPDHNLGWLMLIDSVGDHAFSSEDETTLTVHLRQACRIYENSYLHQRLRQQLTRLQKEVAVRQQAEHLLNLSERFNRSTLNALAEQICVLDAGGQVLAVNQAWKVFRDTLPDPTWRPAEGVDFFANGRRQPTAAVDSVAALRSGVREVLSGRQAVFSLEYQITDRAQERHWFVARVTRFELDQAVRVVIAHEDISERKEAELRAQRLHRVTSVLSAINGLIVRATDTNELYQEACRIAVETGRFLRVWVGLMDPVTHLPVMVAWCEGERSQGYFEHFAPRLSSYLHQDDARFRELMQHQRPVVINNLQNDNWMGLSPRSQHWHLRAVALFPLTDHQTTVGWLALHADEIDVFDAEECRLLSELAGDISFAMSHIRQAEDMQRLAYYDQLTGCANAGLFNERLSQSIAMAATVRQSLVLAILDIDGFKSINDNLGRHVGDKLLEQVARRVLEVTGDASRVARVGADQFALMLPGAPGDFELLRLSQHLYEEAFAREFVLGADTLQVGARVGLAIYPRDGETADALFGHAEAALKRAKGIAERVVFYDARMSAVVAEKFDTERRLRQALQKGEFELHYQPKYVLRTGHMGSVEALIRWRSATGLISPATFIPLMEESGLIVEAGKWILKQAVADRQTWLSALGDAPRVSVNVAVQQLQDKGFLDAVQEALAVGGADPGLDIEITESGFVDDVERTIDTLRRVRDMGVGLAVDDFGTGYSSLGYLARLPLTELKIDQGFVRAMLTDPASYTLVSSMVSLAKALKMSCVAEGVETPAQAQRLFELDCDQVQGYLTSRPVPAGDVPVLFRRSADEVLRLLRGQA